MIDLSINANQPMHSSNGKYVMVYNGEVYNFQEIGARLKEQSSNKSFKFNTSSDTEVILEAFSEYGTEFIHSLNGMFAMAILDIESKEIHLFRDRIGIKPLFYYWNQNFFAFASEMKALLEIPGLDLSINNSAIHDFLHLGFIPAPHTIYKHIFKLTRGVI
ncbi:MAG: hypothetical protein IPM91_19355 [Bacteroidetes bacterium]|nr:hypothetical protein [Bacteroidota bacterium]